MFTAPESVNSAALLGAWCHGFERLVSNRRIVMPLPGSSSPYRLIAARLEARRQLLEVRLGVGSRVEPDERPR
jgi:hypothetical protein